MTTGDVTPIPVHEVLCELEAGRQVIDALRQAVPAALDNLELPDGIDGLDFVIDLLDGIIHDVDQGRLMVGLCEACMKVHTWEPGDDHDAEAHSNNHAVCSGAVDEDGYCELHGFKNIGMVTTSCALLAILDARGGEGLEPAMDAFWEVHNRDNCWPEFEQFKTNGKWGPEFAAEHPGGRESGLFVRTESNGGYDVDARFCDLYGTGHLSICELRIKLHFHDLDDEDELEQDDD